jgi:hypothetical protein
MRQVATAVIAMTWLVLFAWDSTQVRAQPFPGASVGFRNQTGLNVIVKGYTIVNGVQRAGPIMPLKMNGGRSFETNVPIGIRFYTVYDANQPTRVLLRDFPIPIRNPAVIFDIVPFPGNPNRVGIIPAVMPGMPVLPK